MSAYKTKEFIRKRESDAEELRVKAMQIGGRLYKLQKEVLDLEKILIHRIKNKSFKLKQTLKDWVAEKELIFKLEAEMNKLNLQAREIQGQAEKERAKL